MNVILEDFPDSEINQTPFFSKSRSLHTVITHTTRDGFFPNAPFSMKDKGCRTSSMRSTLGTQGLCDSSKIMGLVVKMWFDFILLCK